MRPTSRSSKGEDYEPDSVQKSQASYLPDTEYTSLKFSYTVYTEEWERYLGRVLDVRSNNQCQGCMHADCSQGR